VGIHATILNGAVIGEYSIIGAGTVVTEGAVIPPYSLVLGIPGKVVKTISDAQKEKIIKNADAYVALSKIYLEAK
jgi:carbonic anhydrase/acetyltransferase-like protein (isoleucine patch superfamily)